MGLLKISVSGVLMGQLLQMKFTPKTRSMIPSKTFVSSTVENKMAMGRIL